MFANEYISFGNSLPLTRRVDKMTIYREFEPGEKWNYSNSGYAARKGPPGPRYTQVIAAIRAGAGSGSREIT